MKTLIACSLLIISMAISLPTFSHQGATGVVKERMDAMKALANSMKRLKSFLFHLDTYDPKKVKEVAKLIKMHADKMPSLFPRNSNKHPSEATDNIWQDWDTFMKQAKELSSYTNKLIDLEQIDKNDLNITFNKMAQTCQDCHQIFRQKR